MAPVITLNAVDYAIIAGYILVMILVGYSLRKYMRTGEDFFLSGRSLPSWITGLAFLSANLGALEVIGMVGQLRQVRHRHGPFLLGRGHPGHDLPGHFHDAVLLREPRQDRPRIPQAPL